MSQNNTAYLCAIPAALSSQVIDDGRRGHGLSRPRWTLDQTEGTLQHCLHSVHLQHNGAQKHFVSHTYSDTHTYVNILYIHNCL